MATVVRSDQPVTVQAGEITRTLQAGEAYTFEGTDVQVRSANLDEIAPPPVTDDVFAPTNRPNGAMTAIIAPKLPKSSGELRQIPVAGGSVIERAVAEPGVAEQGGGPESDIDAGFKTPGPQPEPAETGASAQLGAATGDTGTKGQPVQRSAEGVQGPKQEPKQEAKKGR